MKNKTMTLTMNKKFIIFIFFFALIAVSGAMIYMLNNSKTKQINFLEEIILQEALSHFNSLTDEKTWSIIHAGVIVGKNHNKKNGINKMINPNWEKWQKSKQSNKSKYYFKVTSKKTINPLNKPDLFEKKGLDFFERYKNKSYYYETGENLEKFNFIGLLKIKKSCLTCHEFQGYQIGDIRGGIRISIPTESYQESILLIKKRTAELNWTVASIAFLVFILFYLMIKNIYRHHENVKKMNKNLEKKVNERTKKLQKNYDKLKNTQKELVQAEKLASLSGMVAGVAHEINTPIGMALTDITYLNEETKELKNLYLNQKMSEDDFNDFLKQVEESTHLITTNLKKGANLVKSFKQVAVDQSSDENRIFNLEKYVKEILMSLNNVLKKTKHKIIIDIDKNLTIDSNPGAFSQIITNFIMNSLIHGFENKEIGEIVISSKLENNTLSFIYKDNGKGLTKEIKEKIFDPFYTTKRHEGGSGLGMNIIYNIITQKFGGNIKVTSKEGKGVEFYIVMKV